MVGAKEAVVTPADDSEGWADGNIDRSDLDLVRRWPALSQTKVSVLAGAVSIPGQVHRYGRTPCVPPTRLLAASDTVPLPCNMPTQPNCQPRPGQFPTVS